MRTKIISLLTALMLIVSAFAMPLTAYAAGGNDTTPPALTAALEDGKLSVSATDDMSGVEAVYVDGNRINTLVDGAATVILKDYAGTGKQVSVYAEDHAGNRSETVKFDNPYYEVETTVATTSAATTTSGTSTVSTGTTSHGSNPISGQATVTEPTDPTEETASTEETTSSIPEGAFTPDGTGTVVDDVTDAEGDKQFYTITTEAGNVFYLIIDSLREDDNVYFLNAVTEADLLALAETEDNSVSSIPVTETCTCTDKCEAGYVNTSCSVCKNDLTGCTGTAKVTVSEEPDTTEEPADTGSDAGTIIFLVIAFAAVAGVGYYVKIVRPKQQAEVDDEFDDDGYGEGFDPDAAYGEPEYLSEDDMDNEDSV